MRQSFCFLAITFNTKANLVTIITAEAVLSPLPSSPFFICKHIISLQFIPHTHTPSEIPLMCQNSNLNMQIYAVSKFVLGEVYLLYSCLLHFMSYFFSSIPQQSMLSAKELINLFMLLYYFQCLNCYLQFSSVQLLSRARHHESQHARPPCPSPTSGIYSDSWPSSR